MKKILVMLLMSACGWALSAAVDVDSLLGSAAMWLDASSPANFQFNARGGVDKWINLGAGRATYGDAVAYKLQELSKNSTCTNVAVFGGVECVNGVPAFQMGATGSDIDLRYTRIGAIRTVFLAGQFNLDDNLEPLLGDSTYFDLHRGKSGYVWNEGWAKSSSGYPGKPTFYLNSATTAAANPDATAPVANALNIITIATAGNTRSDQLSRDRNYIGSRNGGRALSEVVIFTRVLTTEERTAVYNYLDAKWKQGGWKNVAGAYSDLSATSSFSANATVGSANTTAMIPQSTINVASGKTATFAAAVDEANLAFQGGGALAFAGGFRASGAINQNAGRLDLGGGACNLIANPTLAGNVTWANGTFFLDFWGEFRPAAGVTLTLANGAGLRKRAYWRTFIDKGATLTLAEDAGVSEIAGPFVVTCDYQTDNYLNVHGGALVVTNAADGASGSGIMEYSITIGTQQKAGRAFMDMDGGRVVTRRLRVAGGWNSENNGVTSSGTVNLGGGTVELLDRLSLGNDSTTRALATVSLNGGEVISPNGILMYNDDRDVLNFNGTVFKANADCAKYLDLRKGSGANVALAAGGLPLEVASGKTVTLGWGLKGRGGIVKRGAGKLVLDQAATFTGGIDVQAGTLVAKSAAALGSGTFKLAGGATAEIVPGAATTLDASAAGTLKVTLPVFGKFRVMGVANGFAVANLATMALDEDGGQISDAAFTVENGALYVAVAGGLVASVEDVADGTWYGLPWKNGDTPASYPTAAGEVTWATLVASGANRIAMNADAYAGVLMVGDQDGNGARVVLAGDHRLHANVDLSNTSAEFGVSGPTVLDGVVTAGADTVFVLDAQAGADWAYENATFQVEGASGKFRKTGAGRVVYPGLPGGAVVSEAGSFAMALANAASSGSLNLTGAGLKEKCGAGTLTLTGGTFGGPFAVTGGQLTVDGSILGFSSLYVGGDAKVYIPHCSQVNNRLPSNGQVVVDGGEIHICGVNPFSCAAPEFWLTNATMRIECATGGEHIKFKNTHLKDSTFRLQGTANAYNNNGIYFFSNSGKFFIDGECVFEAATGIPNALCGEAAIPVVVSAGAKLVWGTPFMTDIAKTGPGAVQFSDTVDQAKCTATFLLKEGVLLTGSKVPRLNLAAGTTVKALGGEPLTVTTALTLPATGTIAVDVSAIDFETRRSAVKILKCAAFDAAMGAKFAVPPLPAGWQVVAIGGLTLAKIDQPQHLHWDTQSGQWGEYSWNQNPNGYSLEGYHETTFLDNTNGVAAALTTVGVGFDHVVAAFNFNTTNTPYAFSGTGSIQTPSFAGGIALAGYEINVPFIVGSGGITFATSTADQAINDIRGTLGAINVPEAAGGKAKLNFTNASPRNPGAITLGAGKTLEICANFTGGASVIPTAAMTGDATTKLRVTAKDSAGHMDFTTDNPKFRGKVEIADGGFLHVNAKLNSIVATEQNPVWVHGRNSIISIIGNQNNDRFPANGWALISDGAQFYYRGTNPTSQADSPSLIVSNGNVRVETVVVSTASHLHLKNLRFYGDSQLYMDSTTAAWQNQGLVIWGDISVNTGTTKIYQVSGNPNKFRTLVNGADGAKNIQVAEGALLRLGGRWATAPVKTGAGTVELIDGVSLPGNAFVVNGGFVVVNALANGLGSLTLADGAGLDLSADGCCYQSASGSALHATGKITLKTGARELQKGEYLVKWTAGNAPSCGFQLQSTAPAASSYSLLQTSDGIKVGVRLIAILVR